VESAVAHAGSGERLGRMVSIARVVMVDRPRSPGPSG
jgi:hypothetical protein